MKNKILLLLMLLALSVTGCKSTNDTSSPIIEEPQITEEATMEPTELPTEEPTVVTTEESTEDPTAEPTAAPTVAPTEAPESTPTEEPTPEPSVTPTESPEVTPTAEPTAEPLAAPTVEPSATPTVAPTATPTVAPTATPTTTPTAAPTAAPTPEPTQAPTPQPTPLPTPEPTQAPSVDYATEVLNLVNQIRAEAGVGPLSLDTSLCQAANARSVEISQENQFSHTRPNGTSCFTIFDEYGISYMSAGENIAAGYATPAEVVEGWKNSPGHYANMIDSSFSKLGVGYYNSGSGYGTYWTQLFTN